MTRPVNTTTLGELLAAGERVLVYASDYAELTGRSPRAADGCSIDNVRWPPFHWSASVQSPSPSHCDECCDRSTWKFHALYTAGLYPIPYESQRVIRQIHCYRIDV